ncbi:MAG TPA: YCF48-related protein [Bacteroidia bacterium]|nr:YCF48-related protein [Bacteroidia bacterium]
MCVLFNLNIGVAQPIFSNYEFVSPQIQNQNINKLRPIGAHEIFGCANSGILLHGTQDGADWSYQHLQVFEDLVSFHLLDSNRIFLLGNRNTNTTKVYFSNDGGYTFNVIYDTLNVVMQDIFFINDTLGWMVGKSGRILHTQNGGISWIPQTSGISGDLTSVYFLNADTGFIGSSGAQPRKTTDGGSTWGPVLNFGYSNSYKVTFVNDTLGYITTYGQIISKTINAGNTWQTVYNGGISSHIKDLYMINADTGIAVASGYSIYTVNGNLWQNQFIGGNFNTSTITSSNNALIGGNGGILLNDASVPFNSFNELDTLAGSITFRDLEFYNATTGFMYTEGYNLLKTINSGLTWTSTFDANTFGNSFTDMTTIGTNGVAICTINGKVQTTSNSGVSYNVSTVMNNGDPLYAIDFPTSSVGYTGGANGFLAKSVNGGLSWNQITNFPGSAFTNISAIVFNNAQMGWVFNKSNNVYKTNNGGTTWISSTITGISQIYAADFINGVQGWAVDQNGQVMGTQDAGVTWQLLGNAGVNFASDIEFYDSNYGIIIGYNVNDFSNYSVTHDGGLTWQTHTFYFNTGMTSVHILDTTSILMSGSNCTLVHLVDTNIITAITMHDSTSAVNHIQVYPMPATDNLSIILEKKVNVLNTILFDVMGRVSENQFLQGQTDKIEMNTAHLPSGYYVLKINLSDGSCIQKPVIIVR